LIWANNGLISDGTIYAVTFVVPQSEVENSLLQSKAEENYAMNLQVADMPYWWDLSAALTGIVSDFYARFNGYPIRAEIDWQLREAGLNITSLEIKNYSPTFIAVERVRFITNIGGTAMPASETVVGTNGNAPGIIKMNINFAPSAILDTEMLIRFTSVPGFPNHPSIILHFPANAAPAAGCSYPLR
jgi:hypothetical protein